MKRFDFWAACHNQASGGIKRVLFMYKEDATRAAELKIGDWGSSGRVEPAQIIVYESLEEWQSLLAEKERLLSEKEQIEARLREINMKA